MGVSRVISLLLLFLCTVTGQNTAIKGFISLPKAADQSKLEHKLNDVRLELSVGSKSLTTFSKFDNSFEFNYIPEGRHFLELYHPHFIFPSFVVSVSANGQISATSLERGKDGEPVQSVMAGRSSGLNLLAVGGYQYFQKRQGVSLIKMMMNPMFLMMAFSLGVMFLMPKLMDGMDPEELKKIQEQQKSQPSADPQKMLSNLLGMKEEESDSDSD